jgi:hypothetical protein
LLAAGLTLGLAAVLQPARADSVIYLNNFNNASNNLANNSDGIGGGFTAFTLNNAVETFVLDAFETNSYAILATSVIGDLPASLDSIDAFNINGGGTTFELSGVSFSTNTPIPNGAGGASGAVDRLMWGVSTIAPAGNWLTNGPPGAIPTGFWIQFNSDSLVTGTGQGGWSGTSTLFYKDVGTNVYRLCSWPFDHLKWSSAGLNDFSWTLDVKLTLSGTGWALNITGDTSTNLPVSFSGTFASTNYYLQGTTNLVALHPLLLNGLNSSYLGGFIKSGISRRLRPLLAAGVALYNTALSESQLQAMFGAAVGMTGSFPPVFIGNPVITTGPNGSQFVLTWSFGTLLQATNVLGPWTTNPATSPYTVIVSNAPQQFYKLTNP